MKYHVQCEHCGSYEVFCNTNVDVKFRTYTDDQNTNKIELKTSTFDILEQIDNKLQEGAKFHVICDTCGHEFDTNKCGW